MGPDIIIFVILYLYLKPLRASMLCFMVTKLAPKADVSTVDCFFENHYTNVVFIYIKKSIHDQQDTLHHA